MAELGKTYARSSELIDAGELARQLGVSRGTVYEKADSLGVIRIGRGSKPRLRFDPEVVAERLQSLRATAV